MKYINDKNELSIEKSNEVNKGTYWISEYFKSNKNNSQTSMKFFVFIRNGIIINKNITISDGYNQIEIFTHNYDSSETFDEAYITINYKNFYIGKETKDTWNLDNSRISNEEEAIMIEELLKNNDIKIDTTPLLKIYQTPKDKLKQLSTDLDEEAEEKEFTNMEKKVISTMRPLHTSDFAKNWMKKKTRN